MNPDQESSSVDDVMAGEVGRKYEEIAARIRLGRRLRVTRDGEAGFALVSLEDLALLEHLDQVAALEAIEAQLNEARDDGDE